MKNHFFTHKFLPVLSIFLLVVFVSTSSVFAYSPLSWSDEVVSLINDTYSNYSSEYKHFICSINLSSQVFMFCWNDDDTFFVQGTLNGLPTLEASQATSFLCLILDGNTLAVTSSQVSFNKVGYHVSTSDGNILLHTNTNVYNDYDKTSIFFQVPPQKVEAVEILTLEGMEVATLPQMIVKIVEILLPVCLTVFGVLLVVFLIKSKNLLQL